MRKTKPPADDKFLDLVHKNSKRLNSAITCLSFEDCKDWDDASVYVIYAKKGVTKKEILSSFKDMLKK